MPAFTPLHQPGDPLPLRALIKIPRQPRSVDMVHTILDAGMLLIREQGLSSMTTNRVAERAGISIGSLYQYFANRDSILAGIVERSQLDIVRRLQQVHVARLHEPLATLLREGIWLMLRYYDAHLPVVRRVLLEMPLLADNSVLRIMENALTDLLRDYLLSNSQRYRLRNGSASLYVMVNTLSMLYLKWLAQPDPRISEAQFISTLTQQLLSDVEQLQTDQHSPSDHLPDQLR